VCVPGRMVWKLYECPRYNISTQPHLSEVLNNL
jgi:hypothetical protein